MIHIFELWVRYFFPQIQNIIELYSTLSLVAFLNEHIITKHTFQS